jgi:hypothetical protein
MQGRIWQYATKTSQYNIDLFFNWTQEIWMTYANILNITAH